MAPGSSYRLAPYAALHLGERGVGLEETADVVHADTLFSALCTTLREGWGSAALDNLLAACVAGEPPFRLSSAFPYAGPVRFFPRPALQLPLADELPADAAKRLKTTRFVSADIFAAWLDGRPLDAELDRGNFLRASGAWVSAAERVQLDTAFGMPGDASLPALWARDVVPRVTIDRLTNRSEIWRCGRLVFRQGCGLHVLVRWYDVGARSQLEVALAALGDSGLGGRRNAGYGQYRVDHVAALDLDDPPPGRPVVTLAPYWPTPNELAAGVLDAPARYRLLGRGGWVRSPDGEGLRRRVVQLVAEGGVLAGPAGGALVDVTPAGFTAHPVYRYGLGFPVPIAATEVLGVADG